MGRRQPKLQYSHRSNIRMRVVGFLDAVKGSVLSWDFSTVSVARLRQCLVEVDRRYPDALRIYIVWDNWPNHLHPSLQRFLEDYPRISFLALPTYAPWLNAIEKVWRLIRQYVTHAHPWCDDFIQFREAIRHKISQYSQGSTELLHYVGLLR